jgi:PAS domain S-box-containing protein
LMSENIRILIAEDLPADVEFAEREIKKALRSCTFRQVETREDYETALREFQPDLIISDYRMPRFDGLAALELAQELLPYTPVIILTSAMNEDTAVECMKKGASDYVIKEHIKRLGQAVVHALEEKQLWQERRRAEDALRESEERFRSLYENATIGIYRTTPDGRILMANPAAVRMLGFDSFDELARHNPELWGFAPPLQRSEFLRRLERDRIITGLESAWVRKDGSTIFVRESARIVCDGNNTVLYYDGTFEDITDRKQTEEQLRTSLKEKEVLLKETHHRVKNNLQVISSLLSLQADAIKDSKDLTLFKESQSRIKSMALIHEQLYRSPSLSAINFEEYVQVLSTELMRSYARDEITLELDIASVQFSLDSAIPCGLIINELLSNALKHAFPEGRKGFVRIQLKSDPEGKFTLIVRDNGIGLPANIDLQNTSSLGFQLVATLTEQLQGKAVIERNGGTAISISFPLN